MKTQKFAATAVSLVVVLMAALFYVLASPSLGVSGGEIVFERETPGSGKKNPASVDLYSINPALGQSEPVKLGEPINSSFTERSPAWSPDGTKLAFASNRDGDYEIFVFDLVSETLEQVTNNTIEDLQPSWSPSPERNSLVFLRKSKSQSDIFTIDLSTKTTDQVTNTRNRQEDEPVWSAQDQIAFVSDGDGGFSIYVIGVDGSGFAQITSRKSDHETSPEWTPDGDLIFTEVSYVGRERRAALVRKSLTDGSQVMLIAGDLSEAAFKPSPSLSLDATELVYAGDGGLRVTSAVTSSNSTPDLLYPDNGPINDWAPDWGPAPAPQPSPSPPIDPSPSPPIDPSPSPPIDPSPSPPPSLCPVEDICLEAQ